MVDLCSIINKVCYDVAQTSPIGSTLTFLLSQILDLNGLVVVILAILVLFIFDSKTRFQ